MTTVVAVAVAVVVAVAVAVDMVHAWVGQKL